MAGRKQLAITERQFAVLELLWEHGPLTVRELRDRLKEGADLPYTTVLGLLQGMEKAKLVTHGDEAAHRYRPLLSRAEATGNLLGDFVARFFRGSAQRLVLGLVDAEQLSASELREIESKLDDPQSRPRRPPSRRKKS